MNQSDDRILFSCVGTSDPVRGLRDGSMLHIIRFYRPQKVYLYLSDEIAKYDAQDNRFARMVENIQVNSHLWDGYVPDVERIHCTAQDVSDMDELFPLMSNVMDELTAKHPGADILLNLSSGTTQMKSVFQLMAVDTRYRVVGIQVKNPERKAGSTERANDKNYDVDAELELNEDNVPEPENRCVEPKLYAYHRSAQRERIRSLIEQRDYAAVRAMRGSLPEHLMTLVSHLVERELLHEEKAREIAKRIEPNLSFRLYPVRKLVNQKGYGDYQMLSEYFLAAKNLQRVGRLTDFVLRLNPLVIRLQRRLLGKYISFPAEQLLYRSGGKELFSVQRIGERLPQVRAYVEEQIGKELQDNTESIFIYNLMLEGLPSPPRAEQLSFLKKIENINQSLRNKAAHSFSVITDEDIKSAGDGMTSGEIVYRLERLIQDVYPECDPKLFEIYRDCGKYIVDMM